MMSYLEAVLALADEWDARVMSMRPFEEVDESVAELLGWDGVTRKADGKVYLDRREEIEREKEIMFAKERAVAMVFGEDPADLRGQVFDVVAIKCRTTVPDAAGRLGITRQAVHKMIRSGRLKAVKVGGTWLVSTPDVDFLAREQRR